MTIYYIGPDDDVILYDGVCVFCSRWVRFIATRDKAKRFRLPRSSRPMARAWRRLSVSIPNDPETNAVIHRGVAYFKSDAALTVLSNLPGWRWTRVLFAVPKRLRNAVYNLVAKNRYRIFGKYEACFVPDEAMRAGDGVEPVGNDTWSFIGDIVEACCWRKRRPAPPNSYIPGACVREVENAAKTKGVIAALDISVANPQAWL